MCICFPLLKFMKLHIILIILRKSTWIYLPILLLFSLIYSFAFYHCHSSSPWASPLLSCPLYQRTMNPSNLVPTDRTPPLALLPPSALTLAQRALRGRAKNAFSSSTQVWALPQILSCSVLSLVRLLYSILPLLLFPGSGRTLYFVIPWLDN